MDVVLIGGDWYGYKRRQSGKLIFFYNKKTGEHRLPSIAISPLNSDETVTIDIDQVVPVEVHSIGCQTDEIDCNKNCTSKYIDPSMQMSDAFQFDMLDEDAPPSPSFSLETITVDRTDIAEVVDDENDENDSSIIVHITAAATTSTVMNDANSIAIDDYIGETEDDNDDYCDDDDDQDYVPSPRQDISDDETQPTFENEHLLASSRKKKKKKSQDKNRSQEKTGNTRRKKNGQSSHLVLPVFEQNHSEDNPAKDNQWESFNHDNDDVNQVMEDETQATNIVCELCSKLFDSAFNYEKHLIDHCKKVYTKCPVCARSYIRKASLFQHIRNNHSGYKPFKCSQCNKRSASKAQAARHEMSHKLVKPFKCSYCPKTFGFSFNLAQHERVHLLTRPFKCPKCDKTCTQKHHLKRHIKLIHGDSKPKPFKCPHCVKAFSQKHHLKEHMNSHNNYKPFKCDHCNKSFAVRATLKNHERLHTGDRPYQCQQCDSAFVQCAGLKRHMEVHEKDN